jgi:dolichol-phosphate mannosyltransferase
LHLNEIEVLKHQRVTLSVIIPTYNESENILSLIEAIHDNTLPFVSTEVVVVDDNSPDGTGELVDNFSKKSKLQNQRFSVKVIRRKQKSGLISAILDGINSSSYDKVLVMDADFSHPPEIVPSMVKEMILDSDCDLVVASRYAEGGSVTGMPFKRRLMSKGATKIARASLKINGVKDPMSGFFLFKRQILKDMTFDTTGYKILLEMLVKAKGIRIKEIPYNFVNRKAGQSKLDAGVIYDYVRAVWRLYRYGRKSEKSQPERRKSVLFVSKAARFYSIGATGLLVNYFISFLLSNGILSNFFYLHATIIGIAVSITSNFFLNKTWTFEDRNFALRHTMRQYGLYVVFSSLGAIVQLSLLYVFVESYGIQYAISLIMAVAVASISNFILNKKWTFGEKIWG